MTTLYEMTTLPPAMTAVHEAVDDEDIALFAEAANLGAPMPAIPEMAAVWEPLGQAYAAIVPYAKRLCAFEEADEQRERSLEEQIPGSPRPL